MLESIESCCLEDSYTQLNNSCHESSWLSCW